MATQQVSSLSGHPIWGRQNIRSGPILRPANRQRIVLCGWPGSGKSTWLLSVPRLLIIDAERGSEELPTVHPTTFRKTITRWEDWKEVLVALRDDANANGDRRMFDMVAIDTFDSFAGGQTSVAAEFVMRESKADVVAAFGANGSGWAQLKELGARALLELEGYGYGWIATTHIRRKLIQLETGTTSRIMRDLTPGADAFLSNRASYIGVLQKAIGQVPIVKTVTVQGKSITTETGQYESRASYRLLFSSTPTGVEEMCKARILSGLEYAFGPTDGWSQFEAAYNAAKAKIESGALGKEAKEEAKAAA